jgi:hypothetical protein
MSSIDSINAATISINSKNNEIFLQQLQKSKVITDNTLKKIHDRWQISKYPNFLKSAAMTHTSWEVLKIKFQNKILNSIKSKNVKFVASFLGSSVTAGHDTPFNQTFTELMSGLLSPSFTPFDINFVSRNAALGNNPCLPYDACVRVFAGNDADLIHWEQSFNCFGSDKDKIHIFEQFIRQSLALPNHPIIVFTESAMPNWKEDSCSTVKNLHPISESEKSMLNLLQGNQGIQIATDLNKGEINRPWYEMIDLFKAYKTAGIQMWSHHHYESYKCHGPYVKTWGCCSKSWHPSVLGHELRAAHFSYFWLLILKDAIIDLETKIIKNITENDILKDILIKIENEKKHNPVNPIYPTNFTENSKCYTTFLPRYDESLSLSSLIVPNIDGTKGFNKIIFEELTNKEILKKARNAGYLDYKEMLYGNKDSGPLSFNINAQQVGTGFLCQPAGNWGKYPTGFRSFWEINTQIYLTNNVNNSTGFKFNIDNSILMPYINRAPSDSQNICVEFLPKFPIGNHILTILPNNDTNDKIMISYLIIP